VVLFNYQVWFSESESCISHTCRPQSVHPRSVRDLPGKTGGGSRTPGNERRGRRLDALRAGFSDLVLNDGSFTFRQLVLSSRTPQGPAPQKVPLCGMAPKALTCGAGRRPLGRAMQSKVKCSLGGY